MISKRSTVLNRLNAASFPKFGKLAQGTAVSIFALSLAFGVTSLSVDNQAYASGIQIIDLSSSSSDSSKGMSLKERLEAARKKGQTSKNSIFTVRARAGYHQDYDRLVFDGAAAKNYRIEEENGATIIRFFEKGSFDNRSLSLSTTPLLKSVTVEKVDPLTLRIAETASKFVEKKIGSKLIIDFIRDKKPTPAPKVAQAQEEPRPNQDEERLSLRETEPSQPAPQAQVEQPQPPIRIADMIERPDEKPQAEMETPTVDTAVRDVRTTPISEASPDDGLQTILQTRLDGEREKAEEKAALTRATTKSLKRLSRLKTLQKRLDQTSTRPRLVAGSTVSVSSLKPIEMAIFVRGGYLWLVQSEKRQGVPPIVTGQDNVRPVLVTDIKDRAEAWILPIDPNAQLQVTSSDFSWDVAVVENAETRTGLNPVYDTVVHEGVEKKAILLELGLISNPLEFSDPNLGDRFIAVPVNSSDLKVSKNHSYPQFEFIPSKAGIVFKAFSNQLDYFYQDEYFSITSMNDFLISPVELAASSEPLEFTPEDTQADKRRFFNIKDWFVTDIGNFNNQRRAFEQQITDAEDDAVRVNALINLAKLYFAHGFGHESMGLLRIAKSVDNRLQDNPNFLALEGGAMSLADRHSEAFARLYDPRIKDEPEIALWRGYSHARKRNWKAAYDEFAKSGNIILDYPRVLQAKIVPSLTEATLFVGDVANSQSLVSILEGAKDLHRKEEAILNYFKGRMSFLNNDMEQASVNLRLAANGADRYYRAKAAFELLKIQREEGTLSQDRAAEILERLRFVWRGDNFEINVMEYLSDLYYSTSQYAKSLHMLRNIVPLITEDQERTDVITRKLTTRFGQLFINDESMELQPMSALALYNEFSELTPVGPEGDIAIQKLAERMVSVDLLDRAARLLEHQIKFRLKGENRARVGARLASIRLLDQAPTLALDALENTTVSDIPTELKEERLLLEARAYSQLNEPDRAIRILSGLNSEMAHRLNIDVNWKAGRWAEAAQAITPLLEYILNDRELVDSRGRVERLNEETASLILNQAVAFTLAGQQVELRELYRDYAAVMADMPQNDLFLLITRAPKTGQLADINTLKNHISEVDLFSSFLSAYRADKGLLGGGS